MTPALQWGHGREAMDGREQGAEVEIKAPLQFGGGVIPDADRKGRRGRDQSPASMGPRP